MSFRITGLPAENFQHLFSLDDAELAALGAVRRNAPGAVPCRISLTDATPGEEVILTNYEHHAVDSPYRMRFAIYVRKGEATYDAVDAIPEQLRKRTLAARSFDEHGMMIERELVEGTELEGGDRAPLRRPADRLSASPLRGAGLLRGAHRSGVRVEARPCPDYIRGHEGADSHRPARRRARAQGGERRARQHFGSHHCFGRWLVGAGHRLHLRARRP